MTVSDALPWLSTSLLSLPSVILGPFTVFAKRAKTAPSILNLFAKSDNSWSDLTDKRDSSRVASA